MADGDQHVLVVDDEAQIRQFVRAGMELGGCRVTEAARRCGKSRCIRSIS